MDVMVTIISNERVKLNCSECGWAILTHPSVADNTARVHEDILCTKGDVPSDEL